MSATICRPDAGAGQFYSQRVELPADLLVSTTVQLIAAAAVLALAGVALGETDEIATERFSTDSVLASFRGESAFSTCCHRVAASHLLGLARRPAEEAVGDSSMPSVHCSRRLPPACLDRGQRLAFVLDEIIGLDSVEGAAVLGITRAAFRKRVSRAGGRLARFMQGRCGVLDDRNPCGWGRQIPYATDTGMLDPDAPLLASLPRRPQRRSGATVARAWTRAVALDRPG